MKSFFFSMILNSTSVFFIHYFKLYTLLHDGDEYLITSVIVTKALFY